jgi:hypothetical protein
MTAWLKRFDIRRAAGPILIGVAVLFVLNTAFYLTVVGPKVRELGSLIEENDPRFTRLDERRGHVEAAESFLQALEQAEIDLATLRNDVLSTREERLVAAQLEVAEICKQFKIDLETIDYDTDILPAEGLELFRQIVPLEGGYSVLRRFLQAVESSDKFLVIERVRLGSGKEGGVQLLLNITIDTYFNTPVELPVERDATRRG